MAALRSMKNDRPSSFRIDVSDPVLSDLQQRLARTRCPTSTEKTGWDAGTDAQYLKELLGYWQTTYDWHKHQAALNQFAHFKSEIDGAQIHFIHERGKGPNPFPIILTHGYPDSFCRFTKIIPMLTDPVSFGGRAEDAFDVVVPDLRAMVFLTNQTNRGRSFASTMFGLNS